MRLTTNNEVLFENSEHDFPQRSIYRLAQDSRLIGRIEGQSNGQLKSIEFPMSKINCDSLG